MNDALRSDALVSVSSSAFIATCVAIALKGALLLTVAWFATSSP